MPYDSSIHHRRSIRLQKYDYSQAGAYFVTVCAQGHACLFGEIIDGQVHLSEIGQVVAEEWARSAEIRPEIDLDTWVIMPNHLHGVIVIAGAPTIRDRQAGNAGIVHITGPKPRSLASIVAGFKSASGRRINLLRGTEGMQVWQRNYYEHIIRNEEDLERVRAYIANNPARWNEDDENPTRHHS